MVDSYSSIIYSHLFHSLLHHSGMITEGVGVGGCNVAGNGCNRGRYWFHHAHMCMYTYTTPEMSHSQEELYRHAYTHLHTHSIACNYIAEFYSKELPYAVEYGFRVTCI